VRRKATGTNLNAGDSIPAVHPQSTFANSANRIAEVIHLYSSKFYVYDKVVSKSP